MFRMFQLCLCFKSFIIPLVRSCSPHPNSSQGPREGVGCELQADCKLKNLILQTGCSS